MLVLIGRSLELIFRSHYININWRRLILDLENVLDVIILPKVVPNAGLLWILIVLRLLNLSNQIVARTITRKFTDICSKTLVTFTMNNFLHLFLSIRRGGRKFCHVWRWLLCYVFAALCDSLIVFRASSINQNLAHLFPLVDTHIYWIHWSLSTESTVCERLSSQLLRDSDSVLLVYRLWTFLQSASLSHDLTQLLFELRQVRCHLVQSCPSLSPIHRSWSTRSVHFVVYLSVCWVGR